MTIVLLSGGLDSAVLLADEARSAFAKATADKPALAHATADKPVLPVYVSVGLAWEDAERRMLAQLLATPLFHQGVAPLETLEFTMRDVYPASHWAIVGKPPAYDTPDEDVYLIGRNLVLLTKAGVMAATRKATRIVLGTLAGNPFPDATPEFFAAMQRSVRLGLHHDVAIETPFARMHKEDVIRLGDRLGVPLALSLSCMNPIDAPTPLHCGQCSKCRERREGFAAAGVADPTAYALASLR